MRGNLLQPTQADGRAKARRRQCGFSILEMVLASAILMVGIISVLQLVPASLQSSVGNRMDTMATAVAQRELDQMLSQPLAVNSFVDPYTKQTISLGGVGSPGASVLMSGQSVVVDFSPSAVPPAGFSTTYTDPSDPNAPSFELRWAVFPQTNNNGTVVSRRIIIGCRRVQGVGNSQLLLPVTLDSSVWK
jgi:type II secretory pathway pseudopilin PulG